jgi:Tfp pilus assembly pilus retraction ATPase PilT
MSRLRFLFDLLGTARESNATAVRVAALEPISIRIDGHYGSLELPQFEEQDVRALALYLKGRAGGSRRTLPSGEEFEVEASGLGKFQVELSFEANGLVIMIRPLTEMDPELELTQSAVGHATAATGPA